MSAAGLCISQSVSSSILMICSKKEHDDELEMCYTYYSHIITMCNNTIHVLFNCVIHTVHVIIKCVILHIHVILKLYILVAWCKVLNYSI